MAQTTQNVSNLQINTVVHTKDANKKLNAFKKLLSSFKKIRMPNITASVTGFTEQTKKNAQSTLTAQNQTVKALDRQVSSYNAIIQRQRKSLLLARKIKDVVGSTRPSGGGGGSGGRGGSRGSGGMGPNVPPGVRNNNRLNTTIDRSESLAASRGLDINARANGRSIRSLGRDFRDSGRSAAEYRHELRRVTAELRRGRVNANGFGESMRRLRTYIVATTASMTLFAAGRDIVKTGLQIEGLEVALISITGTTEKAAEEYKFFKSVVNETGVDMIAAAKGFKQLTASAKGTKLEGEDVHDIFSEVSKQSAILGMTADDTNGVFRAFSQIISKAKVSAEELNSQLGDRMFGAVQIAAKGMQMTTKDLLKFVSTGQLTAEEFIPKFMSALKELNKGFKTAAELSKQVAFNRFNNSLTDMKTAIFKGGLGEGLKDMANGLADVLRLAEPLATFLGGTMKGIIIGVTAPIALLVAAIIDLANAATRWKFGKDFMDLSQSEKQLISMGGTALGLIVGLGVLFKTLTLVVGGFSILLSPVIAVVVAVAAAAAAVVIFREEIRAFFKENLGIDPFEAMSKGLKGMIVFLKVTLDMLKTLFNFIIQIPDKVTTGWDDMIDGMIKKAGELGTYLKGLLPEWAEHQLFGGRSGETPTPTKLSQAQRANILTQGSARGKLGGGLGPVTEINQSGEVVIRVESMSDALEATATSSSPWLNIKNNTGR
jgi:tape measure domain-containing protein